MGLMDFLKPADINAGVEEFRATPGARLVDVRTPGEYAGGHIPGAVNVPLQQIGAIASEVPDKSTPLFVYCMSGARSQQAVGALKQMGYTDARNIGGIGSWRALGGVGRLTAPTGEDRDGYSEASKLAATSPGECVSAKIGGARKDAPCAPTRNLSSIFRTTRSPGSCSKTSHRPSPTPTPSPPW